MLKEPDNSWGEDTKGIWSGLMGYLQREDVDMSTIAVPTASRLKAAKFFRAYPTAHVTIVSLRPQPLPRHLAFIRPFSSTVWALVMVSIVVWGVMLWLFQRMWSQVTGGPGIRVDTALLYIWGSVLGVQPKVPTSAVSGQVMVGSWLVYCLVIYTGFESELISHLTVNKARTRPPETLEDLVNADGWKWGIDSWLWTGVPLEYFTRHKDPVVVEIYKNLEVSRTLNKNFLLPD
ncbi:hypothetical protein Pcinc_007858 [Petrolisthes cinctipes]|uniref:Ionotropic glutamate receptor C-terminal domain-containing protein n=1 Tax=Petrolisthes cinctipes TaxID=88211 RepID=A0AAE1KXT4_PETCI|nr:hypothetical protein Pcinc_007858 [Petrolisthes cinctipes]